MGTQAGELVVRFIQATGLSYAQIGQQVGCSGRTVQRWVSAHSYPIAPHFHALATIVHPTDRALAARLAAAGGTNLLALGLEQPAPKAAAPPPAEPVRTKLTAAHAETVLCAAAEAMDVSPRSMRPALVAAFARANELGYTVPDLARLFGSPSKPSKG